MGKSQPDPIRQLFYWDGQKYRVNKTYNNSWCWACLQSEIVKLMNLEVLRGNDISQSEEYWVLQSACFLFWVYLKSTYDSLEVLSSPGRPEPINGKPENLRKHVQKCALISEDVKNHILATSNTAKLS